MTASLRTFLAVLLGDDTRRRLQRLSSDLAPELRAFKWTRPDQLHLTLAFLGDVESSRIPTLESAVMDPVRSHRPFDVHWHGLGAFPKPNRASILWAGVSEGTSLLIDLQRSVAEALAQAGFDADPRFTPHVTLARSKRFGRPPDLRALLERHRDADFGIGRVSAITLMKSDCLPSGSVYAPLATIRLGDEYNQ
jgi:2'-5' RNA ligase